MKKDVADCIAKCMECQKVKDEHKHLVILLQPFPIPNWKWEVLTIDFITKLPKVIRQHDSIMVLVDKLTKSIHFILVKMTHKVANIAEIYLKEIVRLHGVTKEIMSNRDPKLTSNFLKGLFKGFGKNLKFHNIISSSVGWIDREGQPNN
jgi:hypothetical protein